MEYLILKKIVYFFTGNYNADVILHKYLICMWNDNEVMNEGITYGHVTCKRLLTCDSFQCLAELFFHFHF